jgi:2-polyprenyl-3-methyl-5-hydroxy-6-metoxy-1,4-benzoquinol methylase
VQRFVERLACPICGERRHQVLRSAAFTAPEVWEFIERYYGGRIAPGDLGDGLYQVRQCLACRFLWQAFHLDEEGMGALYERWISPEDSLAKKTRADVSLYDGYAREISSIAHRLGRRPHQLSLLDFGMGWGAWCRMAQAYGYRVAGFELSLRRREHARAWGIRVIDSLEGLERYDYINCHHALEHVPDPQGTLARLVAALAPGGLVRLSVPDGRGMEHRLREPDWRAEKDALHPLEHLNCFTADTLTLLAARTGLRHAPEPARAAPGLRALARRAAEALRPKSARPAGTTHCFARAGS